MRRKFHILNYFIAKVIFDGKYSSHLNMHKIVNETDLNCRRKLNFTIKISAIILLVNNELRKKQVNCNEKGSRGYQGVCFICDSIEYIISKRKENRNSQEPTLTLSCSLDRNVVLIITVRQTLVLSCIPSI